MRDWDHLEAVDRTPGIVGGTWVFRKSRVPVAALFENPRDGATIEQFLDTYLHAPLPHNQQPTNS